MILGGDSKHSKNTITEFFSNLSMQVLSRSNNSLLLNFEGIKKLVVNDNKLFREKVYYFNNEKIKDKKQIHERLNENKIVVGKHQEN